MEKKTFVIDGNNFSDLEGFYDEIDKVLTKDLGWETGHNFDAFNDLLFGGFGAHEVGEPITLIWNNVSKSKKDLGFEETKKYYENNASKIHPSNKKIHNKEYNNFLKGNGPTLFHMIIEIINDNKDQIELITND